MRTTNFGLHSLRYAGATLWNELPDAIRAQTNLNQFKSLINITGMATHADVDPADLIIFMFHFMLSAFRFV